MQTDIYLTDKQIAKRYGVGRATPWRWVKTRNFPKPIKLSPGCSRWKDSDIQKWEAEQSAAE